MITRELPSSVATVILLVALLVVGVCEWNAVKGKERPEHPVVRLTREGCIKCHSDPRMLAKMADKEQGSTHPLFKESAVVHQVEH